MSVFVSVSVLFGAIVTGSNSLVNKAGKSISTSSESSIIRTVTKDQQDSHFCTNTSAIKNLNKSNTNHFGKTTHIVLCKKL